MKKETTIAEYMKRLESDPDYVAAQAERDRRHREAVLETARAERPVVEALREVEVYVGSVWDLVSKDSSYPAAIDVLLTHLRGDYPPPVRDGIARALAVPEARTAWPALVRAYVEEPVGRVKDGLAVALVGTATEERLPEVMSLVRDARNGDSRILLLLAFQRVGPDAGKTYVEEVQDDPVLGSEAKAILRRFRGRKKRR